MKGFGYAEFENVQSLMEAMAMSDQTLKNRRIRVDLADHTQSRSRVHRIN